jgi:hypothetical protein
MLSFQLLTPIDGQSVSEPMMSILSTASEQVPSRRSFGLNIYMEARSQWRGEARIRFCTLRYLL